MRGNQFPLVPSHPGAQVPTQGAQPLIFHLCTVLSLHNQFIGLFGMGDRKELRNKNLK